MKKLFLILIIQLSFSTFVFAQFDIEKFSNPQKYGWEDLEKQQQARSEIEARQKLLQIYEMEIIPIWRNMLQSGVMPGWGQFNTQNYTKGQIFLGLEIMLLGSSYYFYDQAQEKYDIYLESAYIGDIKQNYEDASKNFGYSQGLIAMASIIWVFNLYDAYQSTESYNAKTWHKISSEYHHENLQVKINPLGFEVKF